MPDEQQEQQVDNEWGEEFDVELEEEDVELGEEQPSICVHAKLPTDPEPSESVDDWQWTLILKFPIHKLRALRFSNKPYKWIRYATGVVLGAQGHLHRGEGATSDLVTYEVDTLPDETTKLYYHIPEDEVERMLPVDPYFADELKTSTAATSRRRKFRHDVKLRDSKRCIMTGFGARYCDAAHLVPFRKTDLV